MDKNISLNLDYTQSLIDSIINSMTTNDNLYQILSKNILDKVSKIFIGDEGKYYCYKTGSQIVNFCNQTFGLNNEYGQGFPTRYIYLSNILGNLNADELELFFSKILSFNYLKTEYYEANKQMISEDDIMIKQKEIIKVFNLYLQNDMFRIENDNQNITLEVLKEGLYLAEGGFAEVYFENKKKNSVIKKLKSTYVNDAEIVCMFKREFDITNELRSIKGIMPVYDYKCDLDNKNISYKMPYFSNNLESYLLNNTLTEQEKDNIIINIVSIMSMVHENGKIHRDLKTSNIYIENDEIIISDFGLGKRINTVNDTFTTSTSADGIGTKYYEAPEQTYNYKNSSFQADVFSLGRIINRIMCDNVLDINHKYKKIVLKATNELKEQRYKNAKYMLEAINLVLNDINKDNIYKELLPKLLNNKSSEDEDDIIFNTLNGKEICDYINSHYSIISNKLIQFMIKDVDNEKSILEKIKKSFILYGSNYDKYDRIAKFCLELLDEENINNKVTPAKIVSYIGDDRGIRRYRVKDDIREKIREIDDQEIINILQNKGTLYKFN